MSAETEEFNGEEAISFVLYFDGRQTQLFTNDN